MPTTYNIVTGDTFESIARKCYGSETEANRIATANPGLSEPLTPGVSITVPASTSAPLNSQQKTKAANDDEIAVLIDGKRFRFWNEVAVTRSIDTMDTFQFSAPFDHEASEFKETFRPFSYKPVTVTVGGETLFTGTMITITPLIKPNGKTITTSGYSLPGVLNDCTPPASSYPVIEFNEQGLKEIATTIASPFGIGVEFQDDPGAIFKPRVAIEPVKNVLSFLAELAKQRNLVISNTTLGELLFLKSIDDGEPVAIIEQGNSPVISITPTFNPQDYYSHITGLEPVSIGLEGSQFTVKNSLLNGVVRPHTFKVPDTLNADVKTAVQAKAGRMFGNMASYQVNVATWRDANGKLWKPNTIVSILAPDAMIYKPYKFVIRSITFNTDSKSKTATLDLVIPGSFDGKLPESLPWDE